MSSVYFEGQNFKNKYSPVNSPAKIPADESPEFRLKNFEQA